MHATFFKVTCVLVAIGQLKSPVAGGLLILSVDRSMVLGAFSKIFEDAVLHTMINHLADKDKALSMVSETAGATHLVFDPFAFIVVVNRAIIRTADLLALSVLLALFKVACVQSAVSRQATETVEVACAEVSFIVNQDDFL